jgi:hypothetical protein
VREDEGGLVWRMARSSGGETASYLGRVLVSALHVTGGVVTLKLLYVAVCWREDVARRRCPVKMLRLVTSI